MLGSVSVAPVWVIFSLLMASCAGSSGELKEGGGSSGTRIKEAAERGDAFAQFQVGVSYEKGSNGFGQDYVKACEWYEKAASQGNADAQNALGWLHENGLGVQRSNVMAAFYYERAAFQGLAVAQRRLGDWYYQEKDYRSARSWYELSANQGDAEAQFAIGYLYFKGFYVKNNSWGKDTEDPEIHAQAAMWFEKAAENGHRVAMLFLGFLYYVGDNITQNKEKAHAYFEKAAELDRHEPEQQTIGLGKLYFAKDGRLANPSSYLGRFFSDDLADDKVDASLSYNHECSKFFTIETTRSNEMIHFSRESLRRDGTVEKFDNYYALTDRWIVRVIDEEAFKACCRKWECPRRYLSECLGGPSIWILNLSKGDDVSEETSYEQDSNLFHAFRVATRPDTEAASKHPLMKKENRRP